MIIDHIGLYVKNYQISKKFYLEALKPLGIELIMEYDGGPHTWAGFGKNQKPEFWFGEGKEVIGHHLAFLADSRKIVDEFYQAALNAGAKDNGEPGIREIYHPDYYGAFVLDPNGHNIEAVCHKPK